MALVAPGVEEVPAVFISSQAFVRAASAPQVSAPLPRRRTPVQPRPHALEGWRSVPAAHGRRATTKGEMRSASQQ